MAGDWIKMRGELWTHPKFIALSNMLIFCEEDNINRGMLIYACGTDALELGVYPPSNESVTDRALRGITKRALRDVTMCALLRVWCAVNAHCKVVELDAVCSPMNLDDLDEIAGFDGFGEALSIVGWVERDEASDALIFRNFTEYNEPAVLRKKQPMTNAERQAKHRAKQQAQQTVTKSNESNAREEKRREELKPLSPDKPDDGFAEFWNAYPRKVGKGAALKAWGKIKAKADTLQAILKALAWQRTAEQWTKDGGQFIPHPSTWLNEQRWLDERPGNPAAAIPFDREAYEKKRAADLAAAREAYRVEQQANLVPLGVAK